MKKLIMKRVLDAAIVITLLATITQTVSAFPNRTPDAGSTAALTGIALVGLAVVRRFIRR
jgi:hypothetical protein